METRASYAAVGTFVLVLVFALAGFVLWLARPDLNREMQAYRIYFSGSVTGLQVGSTVRFQGVPVGQVTDISIDPENPDRIPVTVEIQRDTPVRQDSVATLEVESFVTGVLYVQISGGTAQSARLEVPKGGGLPVIPSRRSSIEAVLNTLPQILERVNVLVQDIDALISPENRQSFSEILANVQTLTSSLAAQTHDLAGLSEGAQSLVSNMNGLVTELRVDLAQVSDRLDATLATANTGIGDASQQLKLTAADIRTLAGAFSTTASQMTGLLEDIRPGVRDFAQTGLPEFTLMVSEIRGLAQRLARVSTRFEQDPTQLIFGRSDQGVPVE